MKTYLLIITVLFLFAGYANAQTDSAKTNDEAAIRANVGQIVKGWNMKSGAEFAKPFAEDADYVVINGMKIKGRTAIDKGHQEIFDTVYKNSVISYTVEQLRFLRSDVAVVHVQAALQIMQGDKTETGTARIMLVMTKNNDKWEIAAFQNTPIKINDNPSAKTGKD
ncbi:MAG: SgcJ/EcaC family oxidoreductase [Pyrinomonadaceae bacterium]